MSAALGTARTLALVAVLALSACAIEPKKAPEDPSQKRDPNLIYASRFCESGGAFLLVQGIGLAGYLIVAPFMPDICRPGKP